MAVKSASRTASGGIGLRRQYISSEASFEQYSWLVVQKDNGIAGIAEPILSEPIDFEAELAERKRSRAPIEPADTDTTNKLFGI